MERRTFLNACKSGDLEVVKYLVSQGVDVQTDNNYAVQVASENGHLEVVKYLLSQGADGRTNNNCFVKVASENGHLEVVVPADDVERPVESPNPDNIIFDFNKIITKPARKYVKITFSDSYGVCDKYAFDIENEADAHRIIKEFIVKQEKSPELVFEVGFCENPHCVKWRDELPDNCCKHRLASFTYDADYTYIGGYSDAEYKIKIVL